MRRALIVGLGTSLCLLVCSVYNGVAQGSGIMDTLTDEVQKKTGLWKNLTGYVEVIGQAGYYRRTGHYYYAGMQGSIGMGQNVPFSLNWYINPFGYGVGPIPVNMSVGFNPDQLEQWAMQESMELLQQQGFDMATLSVLSGRIDMLERALASVDIAQLEARLRELEQQGDTLSQEYLTLKRQIEMYYKYKQELEEYRKRFAQLYSAYEKYRLFRSNGREAVDYVLSQGSYSKWFKMLRFLRSFEVGRFFQSYSFSDLNLKWKPSIVMTGLNIETEINSWILGLRGGLGENVVFSVSEPQRFWTVGATLGYRFNAGPAFVTRYDFVRNKESDLFQHKLFVGIERLFVVPKIVSVSGGVNRVWIRQKISLDSIAQTEGAIATAIHYWYSKGYSYQAGVEKHGEVWRAVLKGSYFNSGYKDVLMPYEVAGMGNIYMLQEVKGKLGELSWKLRGTAEYGIQDESYLWTGQLLSTGKLGLYAKLSQEIWHVAVQTYRVEQIDNFSVPTYHVNASAGVKVGRNRYTVFMLRQWQGNRYHFNQWALHALFPFNKLVVTTQGIMSRLVFADLGRTDKYEARARVRWKGRLSPYVGVIGFRQIPDITRLEGEAGLSWSVDRWSFMLGITGGHEWDALWGNGIVGQGTVKIRYQW